MQYLIAVAIDIEKRLYGLRVHVASHGKIDDFYGCGVELPVGSPVSVGSPPGFDFGHCVRLVGSALGLFVGHSGGHWDVEHMGPCI